MSRLHLNAVAGPDRGAYAVDEARPAVVGRAVDCDICLVNTGVSRRHATLLNRDDRWYVIDNGSTPGTFLNGVRLTAQRPAPLQAADMLSIGPWTFRTAIGDGYQPTTVSFHPGDETQVVEKLDLAALVSSAGRRLKLLTECMVKVDSVDDEAMQAKAALDAVLAGTGYRRAAVLRPVAGTEEVEIVAASEGGFRFSQSLLRQAADGHVCSLFARGKDDPSDSRSISELGIHSALCVPVKVGGTLVAYLYLDARGQEDEVEPDAAGFCEAVASTLGLSVANRKRQELERHQQALHAEIGVAHDVQKLILPPGDGRIGFLEYAMRQQPGQFVAGDLFDVVALKDGRIGVFMGDVSGHGIGSGMLMAVAQSHIHAELRETGDPVVAVSRVNDYVSGRVAGGRFVSLWVGVFAPDGSVVYVDAGHGHWFHAPHAGAPAEPPPRPGGIPIGIEGGHAYEAGSLRLAPHDRVILYSDGLVEQANPQAEQFGKARLLDVFTRGATVRDAVEVAFETVNAFARSPTLDDDATAAAILFRP